MPKDEPKKISKIDSRLRRTSYGWTAFFLGIPFIGTGSFFALAGFGFIHLPARATAPMQVIGAMGVAFVLSGLSLVVHSIGGLRERGRVSLNKRRFADRPWMLDYPWDASGIEDRPAARWMNSLVGTLLLSAFLVPFNWWAFFSHEGPLLVKFITGFFDLILVLVFMGFIYRFSQYLKYGVSQLAFARFPFAPAGVLDVGFSPNCFGDLDVTLRYVEEWYEAHGSGSNRRIRQMSVSHWSETRRIKADPRLPEVAIKFKLPDNRQWTTRLSADPRVRYWELRVAHQGPGINFLTTFPLPVYDCPDAMVVTNIRRRPRLKSRVMGLPYAFELGLAALILAVFLMAWQVVPKSVEKVTGSVYKVIRQVWAGNLVREVEGHFYDAMKVSRGPAGKIWVVSKYKVSRFSDNNSKTLLDGKTYKAIFGHRMNSLSTIYITGADEAWVGSWYGELFHYNNGNWREVSARGKPLGRRIRAIVRHKEGLYIAGSDGLWRWTRETGMTRVADVGRLHADVLAHDGGGRLLAGVGRILWRLDADGWRKIWKGKNVDRSTGAVLAADDGIMRIGTYDGLVTLNAGGQEILRELDGRQVTAICPVNGRLWIGTWRYGVAISGDSGWLWFDTSCGLPADTISSIAGDGRGRVWITLYGKGVVNVDGQKITALLE